MSEGSRDIAISIGVVGGACASLAALWSPLGWAPAPVTLGLDLVSAVALVILTLLAMRARLDFVRAAQDGQSDATVLGSVIIGLVFVAILIALSAGLLFAAGKHGLYAPFDAAPTRVQSLSFFAEQAIKGALFDVFDVFAAPFSHAPAYDPAQRWGFGAAVVVFRLIASFAAWSLVFAYIAKKAARAAR